MTSPIDTPQPAATGATPAKPKPKYMGCIIAAVVLFVIGGAGIFIALFIALRPGKTVPNTQVIAGSETLAVVHLDMDLDDPDFSAMVDDAIARYVKASQVPAHMYPSGMRWMSNFQNANAKQASHQFRRLIPEQVTVTWEPDPSGGEPHFVAIGNADRLPRFQLTMYTMMFRMIGDEITHETSQHEYRILNDGTSQLQQQTGSNMPVSQPSFFAVIYGNTGLISNDLDAMKQALDRMDGDLPAERVGAQALLDEISGDGQAFGVMQVDAKTQAALLATPAATPVSSFPTSSTTPAPTSTPAVREIAKAASPCDAVGVRAKATSASTIDASVIVECADADAARKAAQALPQALQAYETKMTNVKLQFTKSQRIDGSRVIVDYDITDVDQAMDQVLSSMFAYSTPPPFPTGTPPAVPATPSP